MAFERRRRTGRVAGLALVLASIAGCGQVRDVLHDPAADGGDPREGGSAGGGGVNPSDDGGSGSGGSGGLWGDGSIPGNGGAIGVDGGPPTGVGGTTETGAGGTVGNLDPHREERAELVADYCALLEKFPCRELSTTQGLIRASTPVAERRQICEQELQIAAYRSTLGGCYDEWAAAMRCDATISLPCPCADTDTMCQLPNDASGYDPSTGKIPEGACYEERRAYSKCERQLHPDYGSGEDLVGSRATVDWHTDNWGMECHAEGTPEGVKKTFIADCEGPPGGPYRCECSLGSGMPLPDVFSASDCRAVAQAVADGACVRALDCCWTYKADPGGGEPPVDLCGCTGDTDFFYPGRNLSCEGLAASFAGNVVSSCPQYER